MSESHKILVTSALPYANGSIHLGHILEYIQTDTQVCLQKIRGNQAVYACADGAHGSAIMLRAEREGITSEQLIDAIRAEHMGDFAGFLVGFDNYHSTHSGGNRELSNAIYLKLRDAGHIDTRPVTQYLDPEKQMFLADRFIKGTCPKCGTADQYGDNHGACGTTCAPTELKDPESATSGATPVLKESLHYFFRLPDFEAMLEQWTRNGAFQESVASKLAEWLDNGLQQWNISYGAPYFGFEIPDAPGKYFYVWPDAPAGYMVSFKNLCARRPELDFDTFWGKDSSAELYHLTDKDIVNFHALFWPAMLEDAGYRKPAALNVHDYLTVNGQKMSKSRGTFVKARTYLNHLDLEYLRYYYVSKLGRDVEDLDLSLEDFAQKVNSDLVGKVTNIASRCTDFIHKGNAGVLVDADPAPELPAAFREVAPDIAEVYEARDFNRAMREIMALADRANAWVAEQAPWALAKQGGQQDKVQVIYGLGTSLFRQLVVFLKPVLPKLAAAAEASLNIAPLIWADHRTLLANHQLNPFQPLMTRIEPAKVEAMIEASKEDLAAAPQPISDGELVKEPIAAEIDLDAPAAVDLRIALIERCEFVEGADKLLRLPLDIGDAKRDVLSGIKSTYPDPSALEGRLTLYVVNLAPRKMKFGVSEGMVLATGPDGEEIYLLSPDNSAEPGQHVK